MIELHEMALEPLVPPNEFYFINRRAESRSILS